MAIEGQKFGTVEVEVAMDFERLEREKAQELPRRMRESGARGAEAFVAGLETQYRRRMGEAREELVRGLIDPKEFERRGREAAQAMNKAILEEMERRGKAGQLGKAFTEDFNILAGGFKDVAEESQKGVRGVGEMRESFASLLAQAAGVHPVLGRIVNVMGGLAMGSVVMGGVLAGLSALAFWWKKVSEEARQAKEEQEQGLELLERIKRERDLGPRGETGAAIEGQRELQQEIRSQQEKLREDFREGRRLGDPTALIAQLQEDYDRIEAAIVAGEEQLSEAERKAGRERLSTYLKGTEPRRRAAAKAEEEAQRAREKAQQEAEKAAERLETLEADLQKRLTGLTSTAADDLLTALDRLEAEAREAATKAGTEVSQAFLEGLSALRDDARATQALEGLQDQVRDALRLEDMDAQQGALSELIARIKQEAAALKEGSRARREYIDLLHRAEDAYKKNAQEAARAAKAEARETAAEAERRRAEELRDLRDRARLIEENARAALQLANALGMVADETMAVLENLAQLGGSVFRIASGDLSAIPLAIGALAQLAKSAFGGADAEALQRQLAENARQIHENTQALKDFREAALSGLSGTERQGMVDFWKEVMTGHATSQWGAVAERKGALAGLDVLAGASGVSREEIIAFLDKLERVTGAEFFDLAQNKIDLDEMKRAWDEFVQKGLGGFDETVGGALDAMLFRWRILGEGAGTAADKLDDFIEVLRAFGKSGAFADALSAALAEGGAAGVDALIDDLARRFAAGDQDLFGEGGIFAGMTAEEVRRLLEEGNTLAEQMMRGGAAGSTQDFVQARSITEVTATRIEGALYTENALSAERNALLRQLIAMQASPTLAPSFVGFDPAAYMAVPGVGGGGGVSLHIDRLIDSVKIEGAGGEGIISEAQIRSQLGPVVKSLAGDLLDEMDRGLGSRLRERRRTLGRS